MTLESECITCENIGRPIKRMKCLSGDSLPNGKKVFFQRQPDLAMLGELCVQDRTQISWAGVEGIPQQPLAGHGTGLKPAFISLVCYENVGKPTISFAGEV